MRDQIEEVKQKTDIVEIIGEHVRLTKAGKHFKGLCPFHSEKTPSFTVSQDLQIYKCFGCGEAGDVFNFLEKYEGMEFAEALAFLAQKVGVKLEKIRSSHSSEKEQLKSINELSAKFYNYLLTRHELGKPAMEYLINIRGVSSASIDTFQLGFAPNSPRSLINFLLKKKFVYQDLEKAGVASYQKDRFRNRVIFPLFDHRGNSVGLAGRIMPNEVNKNVGKYINSPETLIYHKGSLLYGLNVTRGFIKKANVAVIVEGELDCISSFQSGVKNVVAIKGSALTEEQLRILSRLASTIILALDSDMAGDSAARRGITLAQSLGLSVRVMVDKKYKDPDEFARADSKGYKNALKKSIGVWDFIIDSVLAKHNIKTGEGKAQVSRNLVPILASIPDEIVQAHYIGLVAQRLAVPIDAVTDQMAKVKNKDVSAREIIVAKPAPQKSRHDLLEETVLRLGFQSDSPHLLLAEEVKQYITNAAKKNMIEHLDVFLTANPTWDVKKFAQSLPAELQRGFEEMILDIEEDGASEKELLGAIGQLKTASIREKLATLTKKLAEYEDKGDDKSLVKAQKEFQRLSRSLHNIR